MNKTMRYIHTEDSTKSPMMCGMILTGPSNPITGIREHYTLDKNFEKIITYQNKSIVAAQMTKKVLAPGEEPSTYTIIPGEILELNYEFIGDNKDVPVSKVKPISNIEDRKNITEILRSEGFLGNTCFWAEPKSLGLTGIITFYKSKDNEQSYSIRPAL